MRMLPLLTPGAPTLLPGVFAYMASFNIKACMNQDSIKELLTRNIVPPLRALAWYDIPLIAGMARKALDILDDKV